MNRRGGPLAVLAFALLILAGGLITVLSLVGGAPAGDRREAVGVPGGPDPAALKTVPWAQGVDPLLPHTLVVGVDIDPGTYTTHGVAGGDPNRVCTWARLSGLSGKSSEVIASGSSDLGPMTVTILPSDKGFVTGGCQEWVPGAG